MIARMKITIGLIVPVIFALLLNELRHMAVDFMMIDGKVSRVREDPDAKPVNISKYFIMEGAKLIDPYLTLNIRSKFYNGEKPSTHIEQQWYDQATEEQKADPKSNKAWQAVDVVLKQKDISIQDLYMGAPTETMVSKGKALRT